MKRLIMMAVAMTAAMSLMAQNIETTSEFTTGYIEADQWSPYFKTVDGVLYAVNGDEQGTYWVLVKYPASKGDTSFTVDSHTRRIARGAFEGATNLRVINIPSNVRRIGDNAFDGCTNLQSINYGDAISNSVKAIENERSDAKEVARYNLQGLRVSPTEKGIQIIVYSDFTTKTVIIE